MDVAWYLNHSRMPNVAVANAEALDFVTLREIKAGEELTVDYDTIDGRREDFR
jgi:SET domain-containing protein